MKIVPAVMAPEAAVQFIFNTSDSHYIYNITVRTSILNDSSNKYLHILHILWQTASNRQYASSTASTTYNNKSINITTFFNIILVARNEE